MSKLLMLKLLGLALLVLFFSSTTITSANESEDLENVENRIEELKKEIEDSRGKQKTLSSAIAFLDDKINLTQTQIVQTERQLDKLSKEIQELSVKIDDLDVTLEQITQVLIKRVGDTYKRSRINPFALVISHNDLNRALSLYKYLQTSQKHDRKVMYQLETTRVEFDKQKSVKEVKQTELDQLSQTLVAQKSALDKQQIEKEYLLITTQNDEKRFQEQLAQALAEKSALEKAIVSGVEVGPVSQGDTIGLVGNSGYPGCSTAKHLHFEIRKNDVWVNPGNYLQSKQVNDEGFLNGHSEQAQFGTGSWSWPISDTIRLTQHYGTTPWSSRYAYSGGIHTGFDMNSTSSDVIKAPADGILYKSSQACGSSTINIVYIDHGDDLLSFYLHVQ